MIAARTSFLLSLFAAGAVGAVVGLLAWRLFLHEPGPAPRFVDLVPDAPAPATELIGQARPDLELTDLDGVVRSLSEWDGRVVLLNFWATWCAPCREEMPMLADLQREFGGRGLQVVGVAIDDEQAVRAFAAELGIDYPLLHGARAAMDAGPAFGNRLGALPHTVLIDRNSRIAHLKTGKLEYASTAELIERLL